MEKTLYMLIGLPGCGKSTFRSKPEFEKASVLSTDDEIENFASAQGRTYNEVFKERISFAEHMMNLRIEQLKKEQPPLIIWDQTNLSQKTREKKLKQFPDYRKIAVYFNVPWEKIKERNEEREARGRGIHWGILTSMKAALQEPCLIEEDFDEIIYFFGGENE